MNFMCYMITQFGKDKMNKSDDAFEKELLKIQDAATTAA